MTVVQCTKDDYNKYMKFGLEALSETVERHEEGRYNSINLIKKTHGPASNHKYSGEDQSL